MNEIDITTRPSQKTISRRKMLQSVALASASALTFGAGTATTHSAPLPADDPPSNALIRLIDQHKWAKEAWESAGFSDGAELDAEIGALEAILAHPVETLADVRTKARYLLEYDSDQYQAEMVKVLLGSLVGADHLPKVQKVDPLVEAIDAYRAGLAEFNAASSAITDQDEESFIARTYGMPMDVLANWDQPAVTLSGAIAALRMAEVENAQFSGSVIAERMVKAAAGYFGGRRTSGAAASAPCTPIQGLYEEWKTVRDTANQCQTEEETLAHLDVYIELQEQITSMKPLSARDMAIQLVVESEYNESECREAFIERVTTLADFG